MTGEVKIFVYGSCHFSGRSESDEAVGNGGYGIVITENGKKTEVFSGGFSDTTNARMDIMGITEGLKKVKHAQDVIVYLTNGYVIDTLSKGWLEKWKRTGFKKKKHVDLWKVLDGIMQETPQTISFKHSREVSNSWEFVLAEKLGKKMSGKINLPKDIHGENAPGGLFEIVEKGENIEEQEADELVQSSPILDSICVDASSIGNPGVTEYRGVDTATGAIIFENKYDEATNNIGEFLAIVHALALYKRDGKELKIIYSDSLIAISWVHQKKCKTKFERTEQNAKVFDHIQRAITWLHNNTYETKILKWNTVAWGEIPADYDRK